MLNRSGESTKLWGSPHTVCMIFHSQSTSTNISPVGRKRTNPILCHPLPAHGADPKGYHGRKSPRSQEKARMDALSQTHSWCRSTKSMTNVFFCPMFKPESGLKGAQIICFIQGLLNLLHNHLLHNFSFKKGRLDTGQMLSSIVRSINDSLIRGQIKTSLQGKGTTLFLKDEFTTVRTHLTVQYMSLLGQACTTRRETGLMNKWLSSQS